jgi:hypothetical protein
LRYVPPCMMSLGTIFNMLTIIVLLRRKFGKTSTRILLIVLALVDTTALYSGLLSVWVSQVFKINLQNLTQLSCPVGMFCTYLIRHCASWNIVLLTVERWLSVSYPLKARIICTGKWTCAVLGLFFIILFSLNAHILFFYRLRSFNYGSIVLVVCYQATDAYTLFWNKVWYWIDLFSYIGGPFLIIAACNAAILYKVIKSHRTRGMLRYQDGRPDAERARLTSMTYMLTTVSVVFVFLTLPVSTYFIVRDYISIRRIPPIEERTVSALVHAVTLLVSYVNNSINFLLYCISGTQFRREIRNMFRGLLPSKSQ